MAIKIKDAGMRVRIERELREEFVETCRADGKPAAQVLRDFIREYIRQNRVAAQRELFATREAGAER